MATLLHLDSSAFPGEASTSRIVTYAFRTAWEAQHPAGTVVYRDLAKNPSPHITADAFAAGFVDPVTHTVEQVAAFADRLELIEELESADAVLIGAPMYNFGIPSSLKAWLDNVILMGRTARAENSKLKGVPVTVVSSRGGTYVQGTAMASNEHVLNYLESVFSFLEMDPHFIVADLTQTLTMPDTDQVISLGDESRSKALTEAAAKAKEIAARHTV
jgi:FMN-dependent NADH-azoreductase